ncbi:SOS response-associated peptidase [Vibrio ishigakensis]|nr:SOS response-associated peptidase [Vibrio ishigakensis]
MCGRMNITDDPLALWISENLGISFRSQANHDFRPTQSTRLISADLNVHDSNWGIHPNWSDKIIINARSETLLSKPLFANHFKRRVLVPCSGWYEWCNTPSGKQKTLFSPNNDSQFLMAGLEVEPQRFVTLTRKPTTEYQAYHHRMPMLIHVDQAKAWLSNDELARESLERPWDYSFTSEAESIAPQQNYSLF